ncbi:hypothetical protein EHE19_012005 [Ruminiclostridium herbifermentans]|uniref:Uncharacterized protein n=1 Tax=Ruminiclostridium herbifermentans TaxID=2488810 RepID=A0A4U7JCK1_9FIRM|nr:hypothetical protein [Ruminiclostridium herbifermentans]QNU65645.1 hypothetical protein EHE19_012005 [Ruminiclostridium herbifermentans]
MKKLYLSILYVVLLSLLISSAILISKPAEKNIYKAASNRNISTIHTYPDNPNKIRTSANDNSKFRNEAITVFFNTSDIDLQAYLVEDISGQVSINLNYKMDGKYIAKRIEASSVAEIRNMFRFREQQGEGYRLNNMILNKDMNKVYFFVERKKEQKYTQTSIYSYDLVNSKIERITYDLGAFSNFSLSPDGRYNAFTYEVCPQNISGNEKSIVVIIRCSDNKIIFNSNDVINDNSQNNFYIYGYNFIKWKNNDICELSQEIRAKYQLKNVEKQTVLYKIEN